MTHITSLNDIISSVVDTTSLNNILSFENYPNPAHSYTFISFKLHTNSKINLSVYDLQGKEIAKIINNENRDYGKYTERIDLYELNIASGIYYLKLKVDNEIKTSKQIVVK